MSIWYTTREDVASSQDIKATAYAGRDIDSAIASGARAVDSLVHRILYPWTGTRSFDFPDGDSPSYRIRFTERDLISATSVTNGDGTSVSLASLFLDPQSGPPYTHIEVNRGSASSFTSGSTNQRAVSIAGLWGHSNNELTAGTVAEPLDSTETGVDVGSIAGIGIGSLVRVDSERMVVNGKSWTSTGQTVTYLAPSNAAQALPVADGTAFTAGDGLIVDSERLLILEVIGNNLLVKRAVEGSPLAAHAAATIYAQRSLVVTRGAVGTTAATHLTAAPFYVWQPPPLAAELNRAYAVNTLLQRQSGYRTIQGENRPGGSPGRGIRDLEQDVMAALGKIVRHGAV